MKPINFKEANKKLTAPGCGDLYTHTDGKVVTSIWELSKEDIENIIKNKIIKLSIYSGETQPPVYLSTIK